MGQVGDRLYLTGPFLSLHLQAASPLLLAPSGVRSRPRWARWILAHYHLDKSGIIPINRERRSYFGWRSQGKEGISRKETNKWEEPAN